MRKAFLAVVRRECRRLAGNPLYLFCMVAAPLFCYLFFTSLMDEGLPSELPIAVVDEDRSATSRNLVRNLDAFPQTRIVLRCASVGEARRAIQRGDVYGYFYIPPRFEADAQARRQPRLSFYTNYSYLIAGSLLFRDLKMMSELASGAAARTVLYARGATERQAMGFLQPIVIDTHPLNNPWINYSVYLCNTLLPGVLMLLMLLVTVYAVGSEIKEGTAREWLRTGGRSLLVSLGGKLLPHTVLFFAMGACYNFYLYGVLHFPCHSGPLPMLGATLLLVLASQGLGLFMIGAVPSLRLALSFASLWGVVSFSIAGFSFPVMAMHPSLQALSNLFPLRHYFLIYTDQALNGYPVSASAAQFLALGFFVLLPLTVLRPLHRSLIHNQYLP